MYLNTCHNWLFLCSHRKSAVLMEDENGNNVCLAFILKQGSFSGLHSRIQKICFYFYVDLANIVFTSDLRVDLV